MKTPWRNNPIFKGKFHPEYPDDLQVLIHAGNPRFSGKRPEAVWVRITRNQDTVYFGNILNKPQFLDNLHQGDEISFLKVESAPFPFLISPNYVDDRKKWVISPCDKCGFAEMFEPPSKKVESFMKENQITEENVPIMMTTFCPLCGGAQILGKIGTEAETKLRDFKLVAKKRWWMFWKK